MFFPIILNNILVGEFPTLPDDPILTSWEIRNGAEGEWFEMKCELEFPNSQHRLQGAVEWYAQTEHGRIFLYEEELEEGKKVAFLHEMYIWGHVGKEVLQN